MFTTAAARLPGRMHHQKLFCIGLLPVGILLIVFRTLGLVCSAIALFAIAGGHWATLQGIAWVEMLHDYSQQSGSIVVAVEQTFDGQHPCNLCREIAAAKSKVQREKQIAGFLAKDTKAKALLATMPPLALERRSIGEVANLVSRAAGNGRAEQPPTPPPRRGGIAA